MEVEKMMKYKIIYRASILCAQWKERIYYQEGTSLHRGEIRGATEQLCSLYPPDIWAGRAPNLNLVCSAIPIVKVEAGSFQNQQDAPISGWPSNLPAITGFS